MKNKIARLANGGVPRVLDLFAGCGGFSLGFRKAGFELLGAVEMNREAIETHGLNLFPGRPAHALPLDITKTSFRDVMTLFGHTPDKSSVDVVIGGPPCQAFTRIGRAKLRKLAGGCKEAHLFDHRANLYEDYLRFVEDAEPLVVVMENVYDFLNFGGRNLAEEICCDLEHLNYRAAYTHLNTAQFGVPQFRERVFIIAVHKDLGLDPVFPVPTHRAELPQGYLDIRAGLDAFRLAGASHAHRYPGIPEDACLAAVTAQAALASLPPVDPLMEISKKYRPREWVVGDRTKRSTWRSFDMIHPGPKW